METAKDILLAVLICFGLLYLIFSRLPDSAIRNPWRPDATGHRERPEQAASVAVEAPQAAKVVDGDPSTTVGVDQLRAACVEEVKRGGSTGWNARAACARYERAVAGVGDPTINVSEAPDRAPAQRRDGQRSQGDGRMGPTLIAHECGEFGYGTILYRRCRADEKERLRRICKSETDRADQATGSMRQQLRQIAVANCGVADRYQIVK